MIAKVAPLFRLGQTVATPGALEALMKAGQNPAVFLTRHVTRDWGDVTLDDAKLNDHAVESGERIMSVYRTARNDRLWIITEWDRSVTTVLLPEEY